MVTKCIECGKKRGRFLKKHNYAGLDVEKIVKDSLMTYYSPKKYCRLMLTGDPESDYLCEACANKRTVICSVHGSIQGEFSKGMPPICYPCKISVKGRKCIDCKESFRRSRRSEWSDDGTMTCAEMFRRGFDEDLRVFNIAPYWNCYCRILHV